MNAVLTPNPVVAIGNARFGNQLPLALIAGPCALESRAHALEMASALKKIAAAVGIGLVYKTSFDKANRTSAKSKRGVGLDAALPIFASRSNARASPRPSTFCRSRRSCAGRPISSPRPRRPAAW